MRKAYGSCNASGSQVGAFQDSCWLSKGPLLVCHLWLTVITLSSLKHTIDCPMLPAVKMTTDLIVATATGNFYSGKQQMVHAHCPQFIQIHVKDLVSPLLNSKILQQQRFSWKLQLSMFSCRAWSFQQPRCHITACHPRS